MGFQIFKSKIFIPRVLEGKPLFFYNLKSFIERKSSKKANISGATSCLMISTKIEGPIQGSISSTWELYKDKTAETWAAWFVSSINPAKGAL